MCSSCIGEIHVPDSFGSWAEAEEHLLARMELLGLRAENTVNLPINLRIYTYCQALGADYRKVADAVKKGKYPWKPTTSLQ